MTHRSRIIIFTLLITYIGLLTYRINSIQLVVADERTYMLNASSLVNHTIGPNNHPLLAKTIWATTSYLAHAITGTDLPIFWRSGTILFSILTLIVFYKLCLLFLNSKTSLVATIVLALDPMYFSFSRILNLDTISLFFSLTSIYFLILFSQKGSQNYLLKSGLFIGLSLAAKFNILLFLLFSPLIIGYANSKLKFKQNLLKLCLSYFLLAFLGLLTGNLYFFIINPQISFFKYLYSILASQLSTQTPIIGYQVSPAWSWFTIPQLLTLFRLTTQTNITTIASFQNPFTFIVTLPTLLVSILSKSSIQTSILIIYFFVQYLPWFSNFHPTYYYYILPLLPIIIILFFLKFSYSRFENYLSIFSLTVSLLVFWLYFPILTGTPITAQHEKILFSYSKYQFPTVNNLFCQKCSPRQR